VRFTTVISPEALYERLGDPQVIVFDCRHSLTDFALGRRLYDESHVPGAFFAAVEDDLAGTKTGINGRHPLPQPESFSRFLTLCGVGDTTQIVGYDGGAEFFAPRLWFLSRWIGHDAVAILDGGFAAWNELGYPVTAAPSEPAGEGTLTIRLHPELLVDAQYVYENLNAAQMRLLDARAKERYVGEVEPIDRAAGHIPGAAHRWFKENFEKDGKLKSPEALRAEFTHARVDPKRTVHYCGSGLSSAVTQLAMQHAGLEGSRIYNGSWSEWVADPSRPIATGT
jgi:thiosulfate/3-mercaptopyruvate sulfurtransferase